MDGIPSYRTDQELPGIPLAWVKSDRKNPVELQSMGVTAKFQIVRKRAVVTEQTTEISVDDAFPNWIMERFTLATLADIDADLDDAGCNQQVYIYVPMYRRLSDTADDIWDPEANDGIGGFEVKFSKAPA